MVSHSKIREKISRYYRPPLSEDRTVGTSPVGGERKGIGTTAEKPAEARDTQTSIG
jgi:hypothetical protein